MELQSISSNMMKDQGPTYDDLIDMMTKRTAQNIIDEVVLIKKSNKDQNTIFTSPELLSLLKDIDVWCEHMISNGY